MRKYLYILSALFLFSCAGNTEITARQNDLPIDNEIDQQSVVNTAFDNSMLYGQFSKFRKEGPVIPGLLQTLVPQGMAYWEENDLMVISNYMSDDTAGSLTIINMNDETLEKVLFLYNDDKSPHLGHLGGLAISRDYLWIASGPGVYYIPLETIRASEDKGRIILPALIETETKGSFATFSDNILWIGEFTRKNGTYPVPEHHHYRTRNNKTHRGWLGGYELNIYTDMLDLENTVSGKVIPDLILSIPDEIQGAVFIDDKILLSASFGRNNNSRLLLFNSPLTELSHQVQDIFLNKNIRFWFLDDVNLTGEIVIPPMSEAVVDYKNSIAVLFESASSKYRRTASFPLDKIQLLTLAAFDPDQ